MKYYIVGLFIYYKHILIYILILIEFYWWALSFYADFPIISK